MRRLWLITLTAVVLVLVRSDLLRSAHTLASSEPPAHIYSDRTDDPWNQIFALLFTRTVKTRMSDEFATAGPFMDGRTEPFPGPLRVSTRVFERYEEGDRAIDAFYPSFLVRDGVRAALTTEGETTMVRALQAALQDHRKRTALARALMQSDLWSAFDALADVTRERGPHEGPRDSDLRRGANRVLPLIAQLVRKVALAPGEIAGLPDNYARGRRSLQLPDVFSADSGWIEVVWAPVRVHDNDSSCRRASRVFVKPVGVPADPQHFVDGLRNADSHSVAAVVLVMQMLVIDERGHVIPTRLVFDVQTRFFSRTADGHATTELDEYELSRRLLLTEAVGGGFVHFDADSPVYLSVAGNDYGFASPLFDGAARGTPVLTTMRRRCASCHGPNVDHLMGFNLVFRSDTALPPVIRLNQPNDMHARDIAERKMQQEDFKRLMQYWNAR